MKGREIVANMRLVKEGLGNVRAWCDEVEAKADAVIEALTPAQAEPERPTSDFVVQDSDGRDGWQSPAQRGVVDFDGDPRSKSVANAVTPNQIGLIKKLAREASVDFEAEALAQFDGCSVYDLSKKAASAFIGYLQTIKEQGAEFRKVG